MGRIPGRWREPSWQFMSALNRVARGWKRVERRSWTIQDALDSSRGPVHCALHMHRHNPGKRNDGPPSNLRRTLSLASLAAFSFTFLNLRAGASALALFISPGRVGQPSDVAELVSFLADERLSGFITGQHFVCDGGVTAKMYYPEE